MDKLKRVSKDDGKSRQFVAAVTVNLAALSYGIICGWPSPMIPLLQSKESPVGDGPMSEEGASWIGGLLCLGGLSVIPFAGSLADRIGRKGVGYIAGAPMILYWLLAIFATNHVCLYVARFIGGMGGAMSMFIVPMYVSEIASEEVRGALGSLLLFAINIGILLAFVAGPYMPYIFFGVFSLVFPLLFLATYFFVPESPIFLVQQGRLSEACRSLMFFKGNNKALVDKELYRLQSQVNSSTNPTNKSRFSDLYKDRATFKGMIIALGLLGGQQLSGIFAMISYAETIFKMSGSSLSPQTAAIIIGAIQVFGSYLSTTLMERAGRRPLILISCAGMGACHLVVALFCFLQVSGYDVSSISWLPVAALSLYMITYCLGMGPAPFVVATEIFRVDVASIATTVCFVFLWSMGFVVIKMFNPIVDIIGIGGCFLAMGLFCLGTFCFAWALMPETKGRRREDIVDELAGRRSKSASGCYDEKIYVHDKDANGKDLIAAEQV